MATNNPLARLAPDVQAASMTTYVIAGIELDVYGVEELKSEIKNVACLWLLNPRLGSRTDMHPVANAVIDHWRKLNHARTGLIVAAFDQRNHGSRKINELANQAWRDGNPRHAIDMFSIFQGTAADAQQLITYLPGYVFPRQEREIVDHLALGISLGGHSVWHLLLHEPRIRAGIIIVGCPDYLNLMYDRAKLSKRKSYVATTPPGSTFIGSEDFPPSLVEAVHRYDPTGLFFRSANRDPKSNGRELREEEAVLLDKTLAGKSILNLAGGSDKLVPYAKTEPFMKWLKAAAVSSGGRLRMSIQDIVYPGVGHEMTADMLKESLIFLEEAVAQSATRSKSNL